MTLLRVLGDVERSDLKQTTWHGWILSSALDKNQMGNTRAAAMDEPSGDEWWCEDATAGFGCGNFTIGSFGKFTSPLLAVELIHDARQAFPDATIDIFLDSSTEPIVRTLNERGLIASQQIELSQELESQGWKAFGLANRLHY